MNDSFDLIALVCTPAVMTKVEARDLALAVSGLEWRGRLAALAELDAAAVRIAVLGQAVRALLSYCGFIGLSGKSDCRW